MGGGGRWRSLANAGGRWPGWEGGGGGRRGGYQISFDLIETSADYDKDEEAEPRPRDPETQPRRRGCSVLLMTEMTRYYFR